MRFHARPLALLLLLGGLWAIGGADAHAATYLQPDSSGSIPVSSCVGATCQLVQNLPGASYPSYPVGTANLYFLFGVKGVLTAGTSDFSILTQSGGHYCGDYTFTTGDALENSDGAMHIYSVENDFSVADAQCASQPLKVEFYSIGNPTTPGFAAADASNSIVFLGIDGSSIVDPDPIGTTGVVRINTPAFQATTTSPVAVSFDYTLATSSSPSEDNLAFSNYRLQFTNQETQATFTKFGVLSHDAYGTWNQTDSVSLTGDGTWLLSIGLATDGTGGGRNYSPRGFLVYFGLNVLDITGIPPQYLPPQQTAYASTSCAISFAGTFDMPQCLGYLIVPTTGSSSPLRNIQTLTLANTFPFAYIYQVGDIRNALFTASSTASTSIAITVPWFGGGTTQFTFLSNAMLSGVPYAAWIKTILGFLLWLMLVELIYYQVIRSHDENTPAV